jgi:uncharacterized RDD family membrane protein YckC
MPDPSAANVHGFTDFWEYYSELMMTREVAYAVISTLSAYLGYCMVMEARFASTLGKMAFKLRVVAGDGTRPGAREVLVRNLIKILEISWPWLLVIIPLLNPARQRLGDLLAKTIVVEKTDVPPSPPTDVDEETHSDIHETDEAQGPFRQTASEESESSGEDRS